LILFCSESDVSDLEEHTIFLAKIFWSNYEEITARRDFVYLKISVDARKARVYK
jgi:hypothetical protein